MGLHAPTANVGEFAGDLYAAIEAVPRAERNIEPWLKSLDRIENQSHLIEVMAVDTWLVNDDRNMGNVIGSSIGEGRVRVYMIDFEKFRTLGQNPFISSGSVDPKYLQPKEDLRKLLSQRRPSKFPTEIMDKIRVVSGEQIMETIAPVAKELPYVNWWEDSVEVLCRRAKNIDTLVNEVWSAWKTN